MQQLIGLLPIVAMLGLFYVMVFVPEKKRRKKYEEMLTTLKMNDEIMTKGGIMGRIVNIQDDYIILESGPDRARIKIAKQGINNLIKAAEVALTKED
ncbi:preprotein translocase subunit YajC [Clostridium sp. UBA6640]|uniref:preprotein translocase subunit YajC n=1 Tax=Clostridium sp. UBA6640 TaxID=1946370 RepID=UPI0025C10BC3|nr:preprotein translocase subunit YajC [Clostridium sp. UBA6640]